MKRKLHLQQNKKINNLSGFTLIEIMVATTLFVVVAVGGLSVLITSQRVYRRISSNRVAIDNINLVEDTMTREIKFGSKYGCINTSDHGSFNRAENQDYNSFSESLLFSQTNGLCNAIAFTPQNDLDKKVVYYFDNVANSIHQATYNRLVGNNFGLSAGEDLILTSEDFQVNNFWFLVDGIDPTDFIQARVKIYISGVVAIEKNSDGLTTSTTTIFLQSSTVQRVLDN